MAKQAVTITGTVCPAFIARILMPAPRWALKITARTVGAKVQSALHYGPVAQVAEATLSEKDRQRAYRAGAPLAGSLR